LEFAQVALRDLYKLLVIVALALGIFPCVCLGP